MFQDNQDSSGSTKEFFNMFQKFLFLQGSINDEQCTTTKNNSDDVVRQVKKLLVCVNEA